MKNFTLHLSSFTFLLALFLFSFSSNVYGQVIDPNDPQSLDGPLCVVHSNEVYTVELGGPGQTNSSQIISGTSFNNAKIRIVGNFNFDSPFTLNNCIVRISPGVRITIQSQGVEFRDSDFFACADMWEGIWVAFNAGFTIKGCEVEDAERAVLCPFRASLIVNSNIFNRNTIGIDLNFDGNSFNLPPGFPGTIPAAIQDHQLTNYHIAGNTFSCSPQYLNGTSNQVGFAGVVLRSYTLTIGGWLTYNQKTLFRDIQFGIIGSQDPLVQCNVIAYGCLFENLRNDGIFLTTGTLNIRASEFTNCQRHSIHIQSAGDVSISNSIFTYNDEIGITDTNHFQGIRIDAVGFVNREIHIYQCRFFVDFLDQIKQERLIGINLSNLAVQTTAIIEDNGFNFNFNTIEGPGILPEMHCVLLDNIFPITSNTIIINNDFNVRQQNPIDAEVSFAIRAVDGEKNNINILSNRYSSDELAFREIAISASGSANGIGNVITNNTFLFNPNTLQSASFNAGIFVLNFPLEVCDNLIRECNTGMVFLGTNFPTPVRGNRIFGGGRYLDILNFGIGEQGTDDGEHHGNEFRLKVNCIWPLGSFANADNPALSRFRINTPQSIEAPPGQGCFTFFSPFHPSRLTPNDGTFFVEDLQGNIPNELCSAIFFNEPPSTEDKIIADGTFSNYSLRNQ